MNGAPRHPAHPALHAEFARLLRRAGGTADPAPYAANLLERWSQPHRRYHTVDHLAAVLGHVDRLADHAADPDTVRLAAWFHDAVHRPDRSENEERSAVLAERALAEAGLAADRVAAVARLVRLTASHSPGSDDRDGRVLCDADLAVLAADPDGYARYAAAVREEYARVPGPVFRAARAEVLRRLLALPALFGTPYGAARWEAPARRNLTAEIALLTRPDPDGAAQDGGPRHGAPGATRPGARGPAGR